MRGLTSDGCGVVAEIGVLCCKAGEALCKDGETESASEGVAKSFWLGLFLVCRVPLGAATNKDERALKLVCVHAVLSVAFMLSSASCFDT